MARKKSNGVLSRYREGRKVHPFWKTGGYNTRTLFMPSIEAHGVLAKELEARKLQLDPAEVAAIETAALVNTLKAYRAGIVQILRRRYVRGDSWWRPFVTVKYPRGRTALHTTKKYGTAYKNIVGGWVRVKGPKKVNIKEWELSYGKKGLGVQVLRYGGFKEVRTSFLGHGHGGRVLAYRRTGEFYTDNNGWIREHITPVSTTAGLEILQENRRRLPELDTLREDVGLYMQRSVIGQLDLMLRRRKGRKS